MSLQWNGHLLMQQIEVAAARGALETAVFLMNEHLRRLSVPNPPPYRNSSRPGEYPRERTGAGKRQLSVAPQTVTGVMQKGYVWIGYTGDAHLSTLEQVRDRLGLERTLRDLKPRLAKLATTYYRT